MKIIVVSFLVIFLKTSDQQCLTKSDDNLTSSHLANLYTGQQIFSFRLLETITQLYPTSNNILFSPYTTYQAALVAYFLSNGQTENSLMKILGLDSTKIIQTKLDLYGAYKFEKLLTNVEKLNKSYDLVDFNKIYISDNIDVRACIADLFETELRKISFKTNPENARTTINADVKKETNNAIAALVAPGRIDKDTSLAFVNAVYFRGNLETPFNPTETRVEIFYVSSTRRKSVAMMHVQDVFNHEVSLDLEAHVLEMPYEGGVVSMFVILPATINEKSFDTTLERLTLENFEKMINRNRILSKTVRVSIPKFELEQTIELVPVFESFGSDITLRNNASFSTLSSTENISFNRGIHRARVTFKEQTVAQSGGGQFIWSIANNEDDAPIEFKCNRPFIFVIYKRTTQTILFIGVYRE